MEINNIVDPLDELLKMNLDEVFELVKSLYNDYIEDEGVKPEVAKVKALEDVVLWYYDNKEKEISLREKVKTL